MNTQESGTTPPEEMPAAKSTPRRIVTGLVFIISLAMVVIGARWIYYRSGHVVIDDAVIKGTITKLGSRLDGQVKAILVAEGQQVRKGELLVQLEDQHFQAALQEEWAELESATNELQSEQMAIAEERRRLPMEVERTDSLRRSAAAVLEGAQSNAERLSNEYVRIRALNKEGMASTSDLDLITGERGQALAQVKSTTSLREAAESGYQTAQLQLEALRVREARLGVLRAQVSLARAKIALAQANLEATLLRAPEDGWVVERIVEAGGSAKVGEPMLSLWIGRPWVEAWADEKSLRRLHLGNPAAVSLDAFPGRTLRGRIEAFGLLTDKELTNRPVPSTLDAILRKGAMVRLRIALEDIHPRLQPGLSAVVGIVKSSSITMPQEGPLLGQARPLTARFNARRSVTQNNLTQNNLEADLNPSD